MLNLCHVCNTSKWKREKRSYLFSRVSQVLDIFRRNSAAHFCCLVLWTLSSGILFLAMRFKMSYCKNVSLWHILFVPNDSYSSHSITKNTFFWNFRQFFLTMLVTCPLSSITLSRMWCTLSLVKKYAFQGGFWMTACTSGYIVLAFTSVVRVCEFQWITVTWQQTNYLKFQIGLHFKIRRYSYIMIS